MNKDTKPKASEGERIELTATPTAPRRDAFSVGEWRAAMKQAESVDYPSRTKLYDIYNDMMLDLHLTSVVEKRLDKIRGARIVFDTGGGAVNPRIDDMLYTSWFRDMLADFVSARMWGYSASWLDLSGGEFHKYKLLPRKHIIPEKGLFIQKQTDRTGIDITQPPYSDFIITAGDTHDLGLLLKACSWIALKRGDISDWAAFNEMFAAPFRKGKYPLHDTEAKKALAEAMQHLGFANWTVHPEGTEIDFLQSNSPGGSAETYKGFAKFANDEISKAFLRGTMTLDAEGGQYKGDVHAESEQDVFESDGQWCLDILNTQFTRLLEIHGFNPGKGFFSIPEKERMSLTERMAIDVQAAEHIEIPPEYWYEKYGYPLPKGGAKAKSQPTLEVMARMQQDITGALRAEIADLKAQLRSEAEPLPVDPKPKRSFFG